MYRKELKAGQGKIGKRIFGQNFIKKTENKSASYTVDFIKCKKIYAGKEISK